MKKTILAVLFVAMFVASSVLVMPARAGNGIPTTAYLDIAPNPVGLNEEILVIMWIQADPMPGVAFYDLTVEIHRPDGYQYTLGPFDTDTDGMGYFICIVDMLGTYSFELHFPGNSFGECLVIEYLPSNSDVYYLVVQEDPVYPTIVPEGGNMEVFPHPEVSLVFDLVTMIGILQVDESMTGPPPDEGSLIGPYYYVTTTAAFSDEITVRINYNDVGLDPEDEQALCMIQTEIVPGDVNLDGIVNSRDIRAIARALPSYPGHRRWDQSCDLNKDNEVNTVDLLIAVKNRGMKSQWTPITISVDPVNNIIIGQTDHLDELDPFGVR